MKALGTAGGAGEMGGFGSGAGDKRAADAGDHGEAAKIAQLLGVKSVALSITHTESQALAQVIFEG